MADVVRVRLLGGFEASSGERRIPAGGWRLRKAKTLVKLLALEPAHTMHVERAADALWPELDASAARNNLHQAVYVARRALSSLAVDGSALITLHDDLLTLGHDVVVDVDELRAATRDATEDGDVDRLASLLQDSPTELLPEDAYETWLQPHAAAWREWRTHVVLDVASRQLALGVGEQAVVLLTPVVATDPLNEPAIRALMRALTISGRRSEALVVYERARARLHDELGSDPEPETRTLFREILTASPKPAAGRLAAPIPQQRTGDNLPVLVTSLVGRTRELEEVTATLARARLLTLTGMGGVGKTSLAIAAARHVADQFSDGAYLVELAAARDGDEVAPQLARTLSLAVPSEASAAEAVVAQLRERRILVVLDNCEHLLDACASLVAALLRGCPHVRVLATSREPLRVDGEVSWRTPSLELPDPGCTDEVELRRSPSVDLFVQRAAASLPGFVLTRDNAAAVTTICHRLDGIPLALELAAACVPMLAPEQIAARLDDAIALLRHGDRALTRQQTLEATLGWTHQLLSGDERTLFRRLSVFAGSFTLGAVEAVAAHDLTTDVAMSSLARLVDTSLVAVDLCGDSTRYRLLETVRQYAARQLHGSQEQHAVERRHCDWYVAYAAARDPEQLLMSTVVPAALDIEHDNLRAALAWALQHDPQVALGLCVSLWRYWLARGFLAEGHRWLEAVLEAVVTPSADRARALIALAAFDVRRGEGHRLRTLGAESVAIHRSLNDDAGLARALAADAVIAFLRGAWQECWDRTLESREVAARSGSTELEISASHVQGMVRAAQGRLTEARDAFEEARAMLSWVADAPRPFLRPLSQGFAVEGASGAHVRVYFEETVLHGRIVGPQQADAHLLCNLADVARGAGDLDEALALVERAEAVFAHIGDTDGHAVALNRRGCLHRVRGEHDAGRDALFRSLELRKRTGERRGIALTNTNIGLLLAAQGDTKGGVRLIEDQIARAAEIRDVAGHLGLSVTLASVLADAGDFEGACEHLGSVIESIAGIPGGSRAAVWALLMHAGLLEQAGESGNARRAHADARERFSALGIIDGLAVIDGLAGARRS